MNNIHIISVGASIITNYNREKDKIDIPSIDEDAQFENIWTDKTKFNKILDFAKINADKASAEMNALKSFIEDGKVDEVHLIVTDTFVGRITSEIIKSILSEKKITATVKVIPGYYKEKAKSEEEAESKFVEGLSNLRDSLLRYIKEKKKNPENIILINATGGFKPEILILMLVGSITNCEVYYKHEFFKRIVFLPPVFLPFINGKISSALIYLNNLTSKRISGENQCGEFKKNFEDIYGDLINYKLISEKFGEKDNKLFEIAITDYGKLLTNLQSDP